MGHGELTGPAVRPVPVGRMPHQGEGLRGARRLQCRQGRSLGGFHMAPCGRGRGRAISSGDVVHDAELASLLNGFAGGRLLS
jgi:hypothetical protein